MYEKDGNSGDEKLFNHYEEIKNSFLYLEELAGRREQVVADNLEDNVELINIAISMMTEEDLSNPAHLRILLSHRPEYPETYAKFDYDLVLAGHANGGQWRCPFVNRGTLSPDQWFFPKYVDGLYRLSNGSPMIVSRGLARESSPIPRFFNHPEVLFVDLVK